MFIKNKQQRDRQTDRLQLVSDEATALGYAALRRATYIQDQVEAAEGMRIEAEARAERDDTSDTELDADINTSVR